MGRTVIVDDEGVPYLQRVSLGPHVLKADEPVETGGNDEGPDPFDLLLASLGTCVSITLRMYANRKGWPVAGIHVELSWERFPTDGSGIPFKASLVNGIEMQLSFSGPLSEEQEKWLIEIANKCPVHRTLSAPIPIRTTLADVTTIDG